jgi:hypothetical protein
MPTIPEATFASWTKPAFDNEDEKREYTERTIREAIRSHPDLRGLSVNVYAKGSYKNNTNVRRDSDVDVAVELRNIYIPEYGPGVNQQDTGFTPYSDPYDTSRFKDHVGDALRGAFGSSAVQRANKVFVVRQGTRNLAADVVPCFTYRWYPTVWRYHEGILLLPDKPGPRPHNFPQQQYGNGCTKNDAFHTAKRFKRVVRILKRLENKMVEDGASPKVPSYLIECLVYNVPDGRFGTGTWAGDLRNVLGYIWHNTEDASCEQEWLEVNGIKYLFHAAQKWTREQARAFVYAAYQYVHQS